MLTDNNNSMLIFIPTQQTIELTSQHLFQGTILGMKIKLSESYPPPEDGHFSIASRVEMFIYWFDKH